MVSKDHNVRCFWLRQKPYYVRLLQHQALSDKKHKSEISLKTRNQGIKVGKESYESATLEKLARVEVDDIAYKVFLWLSPMPELNVLTIVSKNLPGKVTNHPTFGKRVANSLKPLMHTRKLCKKETNGNLIVGDFRVFQKKERSFASNQPSNWKSRM
uniref:F-box domain-containing protein n=1 Tax=Steinernema glaseri TaxID=37863 RepID=A0A1I8AEP9_9BILA